MTRTRAIGIEHFQFKFVFVSFLTFLESEKYRQLFFYRWNRVDTRTSLFNRPSESVDHPDRGLNAILFFENPLADYGG